MILQYQWAHLKHPQFPVMAYHNEEQQPADVHFLPPNSLILNDTLAEQKVPLKNKGKISVQYVMNPKYYCLKK